MNNKFLVKQRECRTLLRTRDDDTFTSPYPFMGDKFSSTKQTTETIIHTQFSRLPTKRALDVLAVVVDMFCAKVW